MLLHPSVPVRVAAHAATVGVDDPITLDSPTRGEAVWLEHVGRHSPIPEPPSARCRRLLDQWAERSWLVPTLHPLESLHVRLVGGGALATTIGVGLAHAGVGRLSFRDNAPTHPLESWAYAPTTPKEFTAAQAAAWTVARQGGASIVHPERRADLTIVTGYAVPKRAVMLDLMAADATHVYVITGHRTVELGPWVEPGQGACWWCVARDRTIKDPDWAARSRFAHATERPWCDPAMAWEVTARLLKWCVAWTTGGDITGVVERIAESGATTRSVSPHQLCGCVETPAQSAHLQTG